MLHDNHSNHKCTCCTYDKQSSNRFFLWYLETKACNRVWVFLFEKKFKKHFCFLYFQEADLNKFCSLIHSRISLTSNHKTASTPYLSFFGSELIFAQNVRELAFCLSKEKIELFFQKSKIDLYMAQIDKSLLWIESTHLEDVSKLLLWYTIFKTFSFIFLAAKWELCMIP